jgi:2-polyprenyl-6-methoxyphenol hydroxylase-like FAD-dependent oxidoreductase
MEREHSFWLGVVVAGQLADDMTLLSLTQEGNVGDYDYFADPEEVRKQHRNFHPSLRKALSHIDACKLWKVLDLPALDSWVSSSGGVVVIGDAAHGMLPHAGQVRLQNSDHDCGQRVRVLE